VALGMGLLVFAALLPGQERPAQKIGVPDDWTHHRLIFSDPGTAEEAARKGTLDRWLRITNDPRYVMQYQKRDAAAKGAFNFGRVLPPIDARRFVDGEKDDHSAPVEINVAAGSTRARYPRLPRGLTPAGRAPFGRFDNQHQPRDPLRPREQTPQSLHEDWSEDMGSGATVGLGMFPAKYSFATSSTNCSNATQPDFVVYNTSLAGSSMQASIIAYDNLYSGCSGDGAVPTTYWAYNTGGTVVTSVVLSTDGTQVAFAQNNSGGGASLVLLKWGASTGSAGSPATPTAETASSYRGCMTSCSLTLDFSGGANDSASSVFYDYASDTIYVGDDSGKLHKFSGVFEGATPAEVTGAWPVSVNSAALSSPVFDSISGNIFVGSYLLDLTSNCGSTGEPCGYFYSVSSASGSVVGRSSHLDYVFGVVDGPLVDSSAGSAYVFVGADGNFGSASACGTDVPCSGVFQFSTDFTSGSGTEATVGPGYEFLLSGTFDNEYFSSGDATGHLYVVGNTGPADNTLFQISINGNVMDTSTTAGPAVSTNYTNGSVYSAGLQLAEIYTGSKDYVFLSVLSFGAPADCSSTLDNGCVMGFDVTSGVVSSGTDPTGATTEAGGTSGIIIDNTAALTGASNIYYSPLADQNCPNSSEVGGCAIQISQATP